MNNLTLNELSGNDMSEGTPMQSLDIYSNFLWFFGCIYFVSKVLELSNRYLKCKQSSLDVLAINKEWDCTLKLYEDEIQKLKDKQEKLQTVNLELNSKIQDLSECNIQLMRLVQEQEDLFNQPENASQIFITNRHIHLTRQVFVNNATMDTNLDVMEPEEQAVRRNTNVWIQYLKMRNCFMNPITDPNFFSNGLEKRKTPIVVTTEQLARMKGLM